MNSHRPDVRIALILASVRPDRWGSTVAEWTKECMGAHGGIEVDLIDLMDFNLPAGLDGSGDADKLLTRLDAADGFVLVTPEYNHGYPGYLKTAIDTALEEWRDKPLGFVSYGGGAGGARAVEQLRQVFAELHVVTLREQVLLTQMWDRFKDGQMVEPQGAENAAKGMLEKLVQWSQWLRTARVAS